MNGTTMISILDKTLRPEPYDVQLTPPVFVPVWPFPSVGCFGAITRQQSIVPNEDANLSMSLAAGLAGYAVSALLMLIGLLIGSQELPVTGGMNQISLNYQILPLALKLILRPALGEPSATEQVDPFSDPVTLAFPASPVLIGGIVGLVITSLNLLSLGRLDGKVLARSLGKAGNVAGFLTLFYNGKGKQHAGFHGGFPPGWCVGIRSGEVPRYTGMVDCAQRILKEQGLYRFWDGNFTNCLRYFPTQAFNLAFKDTFKKMFPKYNPKTEFWKFFGANLVSGGLAAAASMTIVYPLDYARTRLASDVGSGKATFSGLGDCIVKTARGPGGFFALYTGFGVSVCGIIGYRGLQLGTFDTITGLNPWKKDPGFMGAVSTFGAAQTAITIGAGATYPFDTVRRRLQMQSEKPVEEHIYKGTIDCFKKIAAEEGLLPGLGPLRPGQDVSCTLRRGLRES
eukprot:s629_g15.t1